MPKSSDSDKESSDSSSSTSSSSSRDENSNNRKKKRSSSSEGQHSESTSDNQELESRSREAANSDNNSNKNEDGVMVNRSGSGSGGDSDEVMVSREVGRDDMFSDAPVDLAADARDSTAYTEKHEGSDTEQQHIKFPGLDNRLMQNDYMVDEMERLRAVLEKTVNEKDNLTREYEDEIEMAAQAITNLHHEMRGLVTKDGNNSCIGEVRDGEMTGVGSGLHKVIYECSMFLRELQAMIHKKDREIGELNRESTEVSISHEVVDTYMTSVHGLCLESEFQKDQFVDETANRIICSLSSVVHAEELQDNSAVGKIAHVEKHMYALIENYNWFLFETEQLKQDLAEVKPDLGMQNDYAAVFAAAHDELFELRRKETDFVEKLVHLESKNSRSMEELEQHKAAAEAIDADLERLKAELEQEKNKYLNTKEKLSMAVSKGKALVQQRDSLRQAITDKTSELEKCLSALQEKSKALEAAELVKEEWVKSQISVASLHEVLMQRDTVLENLEEMLSKESGMPEGLQHEDISQKIGWLVDEKNTLKIVSQRFHQFADALLSINLPEKFSISDPESRLGWLTESFDLAKAEITALQDEVTRTRESAEREMDQLSAALSTALVEKDCLKVALDDVMQKLEASFETENHASAEKEQVLRMLLEASGVEDVSQQYSSMAMLVEQCIEKMKEQSNLALESSEFRTGDFERILSLLYVRAHELLLYELLLEEENIKQSQLNNLLDDLRKSSEDLVTLRDERNTLKKDLERSEEKNALIRERLSMAVKKGKGLVQERENMKQLIDEKSAEIEKLKLELQQQESVLSEFKNHNSNLSVQLEYIPKLEADLSVLKDQRDQFEKDLIESNRLLQNVILSIDAIVPQLDSHSEEPVQKVNLLSGFLSECQASKVHVEQELEKAQAETATLSSKLVETNSTIKSLEDALLVAENNISELVEEKRVLENRKILTEEQLQRTVEESLYQSNLFSEVNAAKHLLENTLSSTENDLLLLRKEKEEAAVSKATMEAEIVKVNEEIVVLTSKLVEMEGSISILIQEKQEVESSNAAQKADVIKAKEEVDILIKKLSEVESKASILGKEKEEAESTRAAAEAELVTMKEEVSVLTSKLEETSMTNKVLEDAVFQLESQIALLTEENSNARSGMSMASDLNRLKEEATAWDVKLQDSYSTIKSLEEALAKAENNLSVLINEKQVAEEEISTLNARINTCMEELVGTKDTLKRRSLEIFGHLKYLEVLITDDSISFLLRKVCENKFESMKEMDLLFKNIKDLAGTTLENHSVPQEVPRSTKFLSTNLDQILGTKPESSDIDATKVDDISLYFQKIMERFHTRSRDFVEKINGFASFMDEYDTAVLKGLQATRDMVTPITEQVNYLKQMVETTEMQRQRLENEFTILKNDNSVLLSSCVDAAQELHCEADKFGAELGMTYGQESVILYNIDGSKQVDVAQNLLSASRKVCSVFELSDKSRNVLKSTSEELQLKLNETKETLANVTGDRSLYQTKVSSLEAELEELQNVCNELRLKLDNYHAVELKLNDKEAEIRSLRSSSTVKQEEAGAALLQASQLRNILDKTNTIEVDLAEQPVQDLALKDSDQLSKLFYIIDRYPELQHQVDILFHDKEDLQSTVTEQLLELERLKKLLEKNDDSEKDLAEVRSELENLVADIESIVERLGGKDFIVGQKFINTKELLGLLQKLVAAVIIDCENSKSKVSELDAKLLRSQMFVDELSSKVRALEDSLQARATTVETVQERSILEAPSVSHVSEISEVEDVGQGSLTKPAISPVPSAAHARSMRKGSTEHVALDVESEHLIDSQETDEDKGHLFKSLNTSGLVPRQGKLFADRVDGIWVTGSRVLMNRPRARLGLIAYWILLHIWLLGTIV